jgi:ribosomal protein L7/L12
MADLKKIKTELNKLTILEVAELVKELEEEWSTTLFSRMLDRRRSM